MTPSQIRPALAEEQGRAISIQVMAFARDPVMRWLYPEPDAYLRDFPDFTRAFGGGAFAHDAALLDSGFGGAAFWLPPGVHVDADPLQDVMERTLSPQVRDETGAVLEQMERYHIEEPHWYLAMIGVDPSQQGRGLGSGLLQHHLERVDREGLPAYLESSNPANVPLYQRHGFEVIGEIQSGSSPTVYPMLRPAR